ncbi:hypothetical protein [Aestuariivirga sp.]|uniref:hypothetical protein n=1 Tax=Aestuariivirga sp. TaxID=2650926 RepID=UPI00391AA7A4
MPEQLLTLLALPVPAFLFGAMLAVVLLLARRLARVAERLERQERLLDEMDGAADRLESRLNRLETSPRISGAQVLAFRR